MALLEEVATYLANEGIGTYPGTIFIGFEPVEPMNSITLYPTGGPKIGSNVERDTPTMQVRVRNETYPAGWTIIWNVFKLLTDDSFYENHLDTMKGMCRALQSQPALLGRGSNDEFIFVQNFIWHLLRP